MSNKISHNKGIIGNTTWYSSAACRPQPVILTFADDRRQNAYRCHLARRLEMVLICYLVILKKNLFDRWAKSKVQKCLTCHQLLTVFVLISSLPIAFVQKNINNHDSNYRLFKYWNKLLLPNTETKLYSININLGNYISDWTSIFLVVNNYC